MNLLETLGIKTKTVTADKVTLTVKVTEKLKQPYGLVHGGINAVLAETAASMGANQWLKSRQQNKIAVGVSINTHHLRPVTDGTMLVLAVSLKRGRQLQTWQAKIFNQKKLTSTSIITLTNVKPPKSNKLILPMDQ